MPQVKVRHQGAVASGAAASGAAGSGAASVISAALGSEYQVIPAGGGEFDVRKSMLIRAHISAHDEADGAVFDVRGVGTGFLVLLFTMQFINNRGIARRIAAALEAVGDAAAAPAAQPAPQAALAASVATAPAGGAPPAEGAAPAVRPAPVVSAAATRVPAGAEPAISVRGLHMRYGSYEAVRGIDFEVGHGEILAFLGPNGAGKTTTVEICEGFRDRTSGEVRVLGADPAHAGPDWRSRVGVVLQESSPEAMLTVAECLEMYAGYYPRPLPVGRALDLVGLTGKAGDRCEIYLRLTAEAANGAETVQ